MNAAPATGIATHYRRYATGNVLVMLAGLVSFPVLTRLLDNTQYGILGYYDTWAMMAIALGKLGAQHAILRFYPHGGDAGRLRAFSTNLFYVPLAVSLAAWGVIAIALFVVDRLAGLGQADVFWLVLVFVPMSVFATLVENVLRATDRSRRVVLIRVGWRWLELALMLGAVVLLQHSAMAAYGGKLAAAVLVVGIYAHWARRNLDFSRQAIDFAATRNGLAYGLPMAANELIAVALLTVDRVLLKGITGDFAVVGVYTIGVSLALLVTMLMNFSVFDAFTPMANRLFATGGAAAVRALKARILPAMTYVAVGVAMLLWCLGTDVIVALSGPGKAGSGPVFAVTGMVYALQPVLLLGGYGLLLEKRTTKVLLLMCATLLLNAALNWWWIPVFGVMGAVYATAVSSAASAIGHCAWVPRSLLALPDLRTIAVAVSVALACACLAWASHLFGLRPGWERVLAGGPLLAATYGLLVLAMDPMVRAMLVRWHRDRAGLAC